MVVTGSLVDALMAVVGRWQGCVAVGAHHPALLAWSSWQQQGVVGVCAVTDSGAGLGVLAQLVEDGAN